MAERLRRKEGGGDPGGGGGGGGGHVRELHAAVLTLAFTQIVLQFRCFLHISLRRSARDDLQLILFSTLVVALMVGGTLVILLNLRERMM